MDGILLWIQQVRPEFALLLVGVLIYTVLKKYNKINLPKGVSFERSCKDDDVKHQDKQKENQKENHKHCKQIEGIVATMHKVIEITSQKTLQMMTIIQEQMEMVDSHLQSLKDTMTNIFRDACNSSKESHHSKGILTNEQAVRIYSLCWSECILAIYNMIKLDFLSDRFKNLVKSTLDSEAYLSISKNMAKSIWSKIGTIFSSNISIFSLPDGLVTHIHDDCESVISDRIETLYAKAKDIYFEKLSLIHGCDNELKMHIESLSGGEK